MITPGWFNEFRGHTHAVGFTGPSNTRAGRHGASLRVQAESSLIPDDDPKRSAFIDKVLAKYHTANESRLTVIDDRNDREIHDQPALKEVA